MGIKNFNVNGKNYLFDDVLLNAVVEELKEQKADKFTAEQPLFLESGKLTVNMNDYPTLKYVNSTRDEINTTIADNNENANSKFSHVYEILKYILGDYISITDDDMANIEAGAPKLDSYSSDLEGTNDHLNKIDNTIEANKSDIEKKLDDKDKEINDKIDENEKANDERFTDVENRCKTLEDEVYGTVRTVADGLETYTSRIDTAEEKINTVYDSLKDMGLIANIVDPSSLSRFEELNKQIDELRSAINEIKEKLK